MSNIQLANNLRHLRKQHELTQKDLSRMLNISRQAYSNYETSKRTPDLDSLLYLSRFYHISLDTLVLRNLADTSPLPVFTERCPASYLLGKRQKNRRRHLPFPGGTGFHHQIPFSYPGKQTAGHRFHRQLFSRS